MLFSAGPSTGLSSPWTASSAGGICDPSVLPALSVGDQQVLSDFSTNFNFNIVYDGDGVAPTDIYGDHSVSFNGSTESLAEPSFLTVNEGARWRSERGLSLFVVVVHVLQVGVMTTTAIAATTALRDHRRPTLHSALPSILPISLLPQTAWHHLCPAALTSWISPQGLSMVFVVCQCPTCLRRVRWRLRLPVARPRLSRGSLRRRYSTQALVARTT